MRCSIGVENFAHHQIGIDPTMVLKDRHRFQQTIGRITTGLLRRATIETPLRTVLQFAAKVGGNFCFASQALCRLVAIEPNVFQLRFTHLPMLQNQATKKFRDISKIRLRKFNPTVTTTSFQNATGNYLAVKPLFAGSRSGFPTLPS